jgi:hypothetical protein
MYKNFNFDVFTHMYDTCILPVVLYGSEIWGYGKLKKCDETQNKAMRFFLGVHKFTPLHAMQGDMGWVDISTHRFTSMIRFWNRLVSQMDNTRITKRIFNYDYNLNCKNWSSDLLEIFKSINHEHIFKCQKVFNIKLVKHDLQQNFIGQWQASIQTKPKLRTYVLLGGSYDTKEYISKALSRKRRSLTAQLRAGVLPIELETGRYKQIYDKCTKGNRKRHVSE